jgi:hypothetical protein
MGFSHGHPSNSHPPRQLLKYLLIPFVWMVNGKVPTADGMTAQQDRHIWPTTVITMKRNVLRTIWMPTLLLLGLPSAAAQNRPGGVAVTGTGFFHSDTFKAWAIILAVILGLKLLARKLTDMEDWVRIIEILFLAGSGILIFLGVLKWAWIAVFAH